MPMVFYTEAEVEVYKARIRDLTTNVKWLEEQRPTWVLNAHTTASALSQLWALLGVSDQTQAVQAIRKLKEKQ